MEAVAGRDSGTDEEEAVADLPFGVVAAAAAAGALREGPGLLGGWATTTFSEMVEEEVLLVVMVVMLEELCCSTEVCFKCLAICASADSEKRMLLEFSTATLTTLTEGSGLLGALLVRQGAAVALLLS